MLKRSTALLTPFLLLLVACNGQGPATVADTAQAAAPAMSPALGELDEDYNNEALETQGCGDGGCIVTPVDKSKSKKPVIIKNLERKTPATVGKPVTLSIEVSAQPPVTEVKWYKFEDKRRVDTCGGQVERSESEAANYSFTCTLPNVTEADGKSGYYAKVFGSPGKNGIRRFSFSKVTWLDLSGGENNNENTAPVITQDLTNVAVKVGDPLKLTVAAKGKKPMTFNWIKDGKPLESCKTESCTLEKAAKADAGVYTVTIKNELGEVTSKPAQVTVEEIITEDPKPVIVTHLQNQTAEVNKLAHFVAAVGGTAPRTYKWTLNGQALKCDTTECDISSDKAGTFPVELQVVSAFGTLSSKANLVVKEGTTGEKPKITKGFEAQTVVAGTQLNLMVTAVGSDLTYKWFAGEQGLDCTGPSCPVTVKATTTYRVNVSNALGDDSYSREMKVETITDPTGQSFYKDVNNSNWNEVMTASKTRTVVLEIGASWCGFCGNMKDALIPMHDAEKNKWVLGMMDFDRRGSFDFFPQLEATAKINVIPTLIAFRDGKELSRKTNLPLAELRGWIDSVVK